MSERYLGRRQRIAAEVGVDSLIVIPAGTEQVRNDDVHHEFRQDSNFFYLTGFEEPDAVMVLAPGHDDGDFFLFVRPRDPEMEAWNGYRAGVEGARTDFGADVAYEVDELDEVLARLMMGREVLYYQLGNPKQDARMTGIIAKARGLRERYGGTVPSTIKDVAAILGEMRLFKTEEEVVSLAAACDLSARGHIEAMRFARPGMYEFQLQAAMEYGWRMSGSRRNGYPSIVAAGANACILHYVENDSVVGDGDLVLIDAAAEVDGYSADITRTFPANGSFSEPQRALYEVVLSAEREGLGLSRPGSSMSEIHQAAIRVLTEGMVDLGLLPLGVDESVAMNHYNKFYFHGTGHWLGMDVHDRGRYRTDGQPRPLEPGMVFTVEPGIYVGHEKSEIELTLLEYDPDVWTQRRLLKGRSAALAKEAEEREAAESITHTVPKSFLGIGVRIEDDVVVTSDGHDNLTESVPTDPDDIEALCRESSELPVI